MNSGNFKQIDTAKIYYELHGKGRPIIMVAGFSCDHTFWMGMLDQLAKNNEVVLMDNRGIGQTVCPDTPYTIDRMADDVFELSQQLNLTKPIIVGQSMGSAIAQTMAHRYPDQIEKIILLNTFTHLNPLAKLVFELLADLQRINVPLPYRVRAILPWVYSKDFLSYPNQIENLINFMEKNKYPQSLSGYENQLSALNAFNSQSWLPQIKIPTLIVAGAEDLIAPLSDAKAVQTAIGHSTQMVMVPGGHASSIEQPQKTVEAILNFIN